VAPDDVTERQAAFVVAVNDLRTMNPQHQLEEIIKMMKETK